MKEQFKRCMQILYPQGLNWEKDKAQHRALIKVFGMAWTEALHVAIDAVNLPEPLDVTPGNVREALVKSKIAKELGLFSMKSMDEFREFIGDAYPDESWRWENHPAF